jgi:hypothetical protein
MDSQINQDSQDNQDKQDDKGKIDKKSKHNIEHYVIQLLSQGKKFTTKEIVELVEKDGLSCPDEPVRFLNKLRIKGEIKGQLSMEHKGWIWWV